MARDNGRTPFQWDASDNAGFTNGTPWLKVNSNYTQVNVAAQQDDANSELNYFRRMVKLRKDNLTLVYGEYKLLLSDHPDVYCYTRTLDNETILVLLSFTDKQVKISLPQSLGDNRVLINNYSAYQQQQSDAILEPYQAVVLTNL